MGCMVTLRRWFIIFMFIGIALSIAGIVFIVIGALNYESVENELSTVRKYRVGAVIDAGGSGTRLVLYRYWESTKKLTNLPVINCEDQGIAKYDSSKIDEVKNILKGCLDKAVKNGNIKTRRIVPLYFGATGGMRMLRKTNPGHFNNLTNAIKEVLDASVFKIELDETISGKDEAIWGWLGVNSVIEQGATNGLLDFGSTSLQISFEPASTPTPTPTSTSTINEESLHKLRGETMSVYGQSYLCFGRDQMEARFIAKVIKDFGYKNITENPCMFDGHEREYDVNEIFTQPCVFGQFADQNLGESIEPPSNVTKFVVKGTGNQTECEKTLDNLINLNCTSGKTSCGLNDVYQPPVNGKFYGVSSFYYTAKFLNISKGSSLDELKMKRDHVCSMTWQEVQSTASPDELRYASSRCFDASYAYFVLTKGFKFNKDSRDVQFENSVQGTKVQWSLGLIYEKKDNLPLVSSGTVFDRTVITRSPNMLVLIGIGAVLLILGVVIVVLTIKAKRSKGREPVNTAMIYKN